jgi:regulator of chromosome condensation
MQISCGSEHSVALDVNGNVYTWGLNSFGQLGHQNYEDQPEPI